MPGPPEDVSASELYLKLNEPKPSEVFDWPRKGTDGKPVRSVRVQVLSMREHEEARIEAHRKLKKKYGLKSEDLTDQLMREVIGDAVARELIAMACVYEKPMPQVAGSDAGPTYPRMFRDAEHVSELTAYEVLVLWNAYQLTQEKYGPFEQGINSKEDLDRWIKRLEEGGTEHPLLLMPLPQLVTFAYSSAVRTSSLFRLLATRWESLPDSLRSDLQSFSADILSFGNSPDEPEVTGTESLAEAVLKADQPLTTEDAIAVARSLRAQR